MLGIERVKRPKQELIEIFLCQAKLLMNQMKAVTEPQQRARQSSQLALLSNIFLQSQDQLKKLKDALPKSPHKTKEIVVTLAKK